MSETQQTCSIHSWYTNNWLLWPSIGAGYTKNAVTSTLFIDERITFSFQQKLFLLFNMSLLQILFYYTVRQCNMEVIKHAGNLCCLSWLKRNNQTDFKFCAWTPSSKVVRNTFFCSWLILTVHNNKFSYVFYCIYT